MRVWVAAKVPRHAMAARTCTRAPTFDWPCFTASAEEVLFATFVLLSFLRGFRYTKHIPHAKLFTKMLGLAAHELIRLAAMIMLLGCVRVTRHTHAQAPARTHILAHPRTPANTRHLSHNVDSAY